MMILPHSTGNLTTSAEEAIVKDKVKRGLYDIGIAVR